MSAACRNVWAIFSREMAAYFLSPMAYVVLFLFLLTRGIEFLLYCFHFRIQSRQIDLVIQHLFSFVPFWFLFLLIPPIITMRLFAEERRTGTFEALMTTPVTDFQVVLGKFLAAQGFFTLIWSTLALHLAILAVLGEPEWGPVFAFAVAVLCVGALLNAIGILSSAITRNQLIAAIIALSANLFIFFVQQLRAFYPEAPETQRFFDFISLNHHFFAEYSRGIVDLRYPFLYLSFTALILYYATKVLEARR